jgi:hypothetical protein
MRHTELKEKIILLNANALVAFIEENINEIRLFFLQIESSREVTASLEGILLRLIEMGLPAKIKSTIQIQSFVTHLALYFKRNNNRQFAGTCYNILNDSVFKKRVGAWLHYKRYQNYNEHISQFRRYIEKLSEARFDEDGDYTFDLLSDLYEYQTDAYKTLNEPYRSQLQALFADERLIDEFAILEEFEIRANHLIPTLEVKEYNRKEYKPSEFSDRIFEDNFLSYLKRNSPGYPKTLLGYDKDTIIKSIIKQGQANFDESYENGSISAEDVVKLYCYFNMRMHFFTSLSIFERSRIYESYYNSSGRIKFIDIGCGPGTSGLALVEHIFNKTNTKVVFDYYGIDCSIKMQKTANSIMTNDAFDELNFKGFFQDVSQIDKITLANSTCIILNACYLFASSTLDLNNMLQFINDLRAMYPFKPKYVFFQNPEYDILNENYFMFKKILGNHEVDFSEVEIIYYHTKINPYHAAKRKSVYFEILKF